MKKIKSLNKIILTGILCLGAIGPVFGWNEAEWNDALQARGLVYLKVKKDTDIAIDKNGEIKIEGHLVRLSFSNAYKGYYSDYYPKEWEKDSYQFVGLNPSSTAKGSVTLIVDDCHVSPNNFVLGNEEQKTATVTTPEGLQYEISINFSIDRGTWMLYPIDGVELEDATAYMVSVDDVKKISSGKDEVRPLSDLRPAITPDQQTANSWFRAAGAIYLRVKPEAASAGQGYQALDATGKEFSIESGHKVSLSLKNPNKVNFAPAKRFDPTNKYMFVGVPEMKAPIIGIEVEGEGYKGDELEINKSGQTKAVITTTGGKQYEVKVSSRLIEGDNWMLYADPKNNRPGKAYLIGIDSINRIFKSQERN